jgi:hypothetical protein
MQVVVAVWVGNLVSSDPSGILNTTPAAEAWGARESSCPTWQAMHSASVRSMWQ